MNQATSEPSGNKLPETSQDERKAAQDIRDRCLGDSGLGKGDWPEVIRFGLDALRLEEVINGASKSNHKGTLIKAKPMVSTVESSTVGNCQEKLFDS